MLLPTIQLIQEMFQKKVIGGKHLPEKKLLRSIITKLDKSSRREFLEEYKTIINNFMIIRIRKRTGKSDDWHISLNPSKIEELHKLIGDTK
jgi:hypothetical protein